MVLAGGHLHILLVSCQGEGEASSQEVVEGGRALGRGGQVVCLFVCLFVYFFLPLRGQSPTLAI